MTDIRTFEIQGKEDRFLSLRDLSMYLDLLSDELGNECDDEIKAIFSFWQKGVYTKGD